MSSGGLADYVEHLSVGETVTEVVTITGAGTFEEKVPGRRQDATVERECQVEVALRWVKGYDTTLVSLRQHHPHPEGGTHVAGFERAMTYVVNDVLLAGTKKLAKFQAARTGAKKDDVQEGLVAVVKVTSPSRSSGARPSGSWARPRCSRSPTTWSSRA